MTVIERWYACEECGRVGVITQDFDPYYECRPGFTHGRLMKLDMESPVLRNLRGAVEALRRVVESYDANASTRKDDEMTEWQKDVLAAARAIVRVQ